MPRGGGDAPPSWSSAKDLSLLAEGFIAPWMSAMVAGAFPAVPRVFLSPRGSAGRPTRAAVVARRPSSCRGGVLGWSGCACCPTATLKPEPVPLVVVASLVSQTRPGRRVVVTHSVAHQLGGESVAIAATTATWPGDGASAMRQHRGCRERMSAAR